MKGADPFSSATPVIGQAHVQFIERTFAEFFGDAASGGSAHDPRHTELIRWIHRRMFVDRVSVATVRSELSGARRSTRVIAVTSGKGGVGKSTFSLNLAVACAQIGRSTLLFDADLGMANAHIYAGVNPAATLLDVVDGRASLGEIVTQGPCGVKIICGASGVGRMADISEPVLDAIGRELLLVAADFDVLVMDTGAGISPPVTHFLALAHDTVVIATPNLASTLDAYGVIKVAHESRFTARIHLLVNQADTEAQAARVFDRIAGCANRFLNSSLGSLGFLAHDPSVEHANQGRRPLSLTDPFNATALRIAAIAGRLTTGENHAEFAAA